MSGRGENPNQVLIIIILHSIVKVKVNLNYHCISRLHPLPEGRGLKQYSEINSHFPEDRELVGAGFPRPLPIDNVPI